MQTTHSAFEPSSKSAFTPPAASSHLNPTERRFEVLIDGVTHISNQVSALSLEKALVEIRSNTSAVTANTSLLLLLAGVMADIQENTRPFASLRFLYRKFRSFFSGRVLRGAVDGLVNSLPR